MRFEIEPYVGALPIRFGMPESDVVQLLGKPDASGTRSQYRSLSYERLTVGLRTYGGMVTHVAFSFGHDVVFRGLDVFSLGSSGKSPDEAAEALSFYKRLYAIERQAASLMPEARQEIRMKGSRPIWGRFRRWLDVILPSRRLPKSPLGKAIIYVTNQLEASQLYLTDGRIPIDKSQSERAIRPLTIGRKNWLFIGDPEATPSRLRLFSVVSSADRHRLVVIRTTFCKGESIECVTRARSRFISGSKRCQPVAKSSLNTIANKAFAGPRDKPMMKLKNLLHMLSMPVRNAKAK